MSVLERPSLEASSLSDLHAIASELSLDGYRRLRKPDLIDALLGHQSDAPARGGDDVEEAESAPKSARRRRSRSRSKSNGTGEAEAAQAEEPAGRARGEAGRARVEAGKPAGKARVEAEKPAGRTRAKAEKAEEPAAKAPAEAEERDVIVEGTVELLANGSGFVRLSPPEPSDDDVYISAAQVKRCELINGDRVSGPRRAARRSERYPSLVRIDTVNGRSTTELSDRARFDELLAAFPNTRIKLGSTDATLKLIDTIAPIGRGSRVVIVGEAWSGKSHLIRLLAGPLAGQKDVSVLVALAGARPEELSDWGDAAVEPQSTLSFAASADAQGHAVELVVEQAKRLAVRGDHAIVLIDSLDALPELTARRALAAARNIDGGGSLTVIATASAALGGETTVITLDRASALAGSFPAVNVPASGTLRPELLLTKTGLTALAKERAKAR